MTQRGKRLDVAQVVSRRLHQVGQKLTPRRRSLVEILRSAVRPLTIHEILEQDSGLAISSAYRNLTVLEQAGIVHRVITREEFARYELAEELTEHHHHVVCSSCGLVRDLPSDINVERLMKAAGARAADLGFTPTTHRLDIVGVCADCAKEAKTSPA
jgi:Fur family transcriptional regulator, ferric uptake regulator